MFFRQDSRLISVIKMSFIEKAKKKIGEFADSAKDAVKGDDEKVADSSTRSTVNAVKGKQGILSKIQDFFTMGYSTKEDLRELDKKLRDSYYSDFKGMRHRWEEIYLAALNAKERNKDDYKKVLQVMDRVAEKINRADYGYAGLLDRKGHVREDEIAKVFNYDKALGDQVNVLEQDIESLYGLVEAESWSETPPRVRAAKIALLDIEKKWDAREKEFRPMEV